MHDPLQVRDRIPQKWRVMTESDLMELRAALMQLEKALETERACVIRVRKILERNMPPQEVKTVTISPADTIAGYATE